MLPSTALALPNWLDLQVFSSFVLQLLFGVWMCGVSCGWCPSHLGIQVATANILRPQRAAIGPKKRLLPPKPTPNSAKLPWSPGIGNRKPNICFSNFQGFLAPSHTSVWVFVFGLHPKWWIIPRFKLSWVQLVQQDIMIDQLPPRIGRNSCQSQHIQQDLVQFDLRLSRFQIYCRNCQLGETSFMNDMLGDSYPFFRLHWAFVCFSPAGCSRNLRNSLWQFPTPKCSIS